MDEFVDKGSVEFDYVAPKATFVTLCIEEILLGCKFSTIDPCSPFGFMS